MTRSVLFNFRFYAELLSRLIETQHEVVAYCPSEGDVKVESPMKTLKSMYYVFFLSLGSRKHDGRVGHGVSRAEDAARWLLQV